MLLPFPCCWGCAVPICQLALLYSPCCPARVAREGVQSCFLRSWQGVVISVIEHASWLSWACASTLPEHHAPCAYSTTNSCHRPHTELPCCIYANAHWLIVPPISLVASRGHMTCSICGITALLRTQGNSHTHQHPPFCPQTW